MRLQKNIGYAMAPVEYSKLGTQFMIVTPKGERTATVVKKPFVHPDKEIPKS